MLQNIWLSVHRRASSRKIVWSATMISALTHCVNSWQRLIEFIRQRRKINENQQQKKWMSRRSANAFSNNKTKRIQRLIVISSSCRSLVLSLSLVFLSSMLTVALRDHINTLLSALESNNFRQLQSLSCAFSLSLAHTHTHTHTLVLFAYVYSTHASKFFSRSKMKHEKAKAKAKHKQHDTIRYNSLFQTCIFW
jgi:hypothetical protein